MTNNKSQVIRPGSPGVIHDSGAGLLELCQDSLTPGKGAAGDMDDSLVFFVHDPDILITSG